jgi:DNA invertase Pin-like site-specific DNA recombinase
MHNAGMIHGYARVSTDAQNLTNQMTQLKAARCGTIYRPLG